MQKGQFSDFLINTFQYHHNGLHLHTKCPCKESKHVPYYYLDETSGGMVFFHFSFIWCHIDLGINTRLFSTILFFFFLNHMIVFFRGAFSGKQFCKVQVIQMKC